MEAILRDVPDHFETERLLIRAPQAGDGASLNEAILESLPELRPWMPWAAGDPPTVADNEAWVREKQADFVRRSDLALLLFLKESGALIGGSGLHRIDWDVPKFMIGYWVRTPYARHGYVTEAVFGITNFAFDELGARRVEILCDKLNERSAAVARRAGYTLEGTLRHEARDHLTGRLRDTLVFSKVTGD